MSLGAFSDVPSNSRLSTLLAGENTWFSIFAVYRRQSVKTIV